PSTAPHYLFSLHHALPFSLSVPAIRRGASHLHRRNLRDAGSGNRTGRADEPLPVRFDAGNNAVAGAEADDAAARRTADAGQPARSEEHTSELQSRENLVCR